MSSLNFAPGETNVEVERFSPSVVLFWLKSEIGVSSTRVESKAPNTLLGLIPLGANLQTFPIPNIASVNVNTRFSIWRAIWGVVWLVVGAATVKNGIGVVFILLGISMLANAMSATLNLVNNGGGVNSLQVSILEKAKLQQFAQEINQRVLADHAALRHNEHMNVQAQQLMVQQQQLNAQIMQQNATLQNQHQVSDD
jgi:hypothetical protein